MTLQTNVCLIPDRKGATARKTDRGKEDESVKQMRRSRNSRDEEELPAESIDKEQQTPTVNTSHFSSTCSDLFAVRKCVCVCV